MALQKSYTRFGFTFADAYHWVNAINCTNTQAVNIQVNIYVNNTARTTGEEPIGTRNYSLAYTETVPGGPWDNPVQFAYGYLKQQPDYADATNV